MNSQFANVTNVGILISTKLKTTEDFRNDLTMRTREDIKSTLNSQLSCETEKVGKLIAKPIKTDVYKRQNYG